MTPDPQQLWSALDATWPAASEHPLGPFVLRDGKGGGKRVSATHWTGEPFTEQDLDQVEAVMARPLFQVRESEGTLDASLAARGYDIFDRTQFYMAPIADVAEVDRHAMCLWPPLAFQTEVWAAGGVGPERVNVMGRAAVPKTAIMTRRGDVPAGTVYAAIHDGLAMLHALEVSPHQRRQGVGTALVRMVAAWGLRNGAQHLGLLVTEANMPANALYSAMGMRIVSRYHYRMLGDKG